MTYTDRTRSAALTDGSGEVACRVDPYTTTEDDFKWAYCLGDSCLRIEGLCRLATEDPTPGAVSVTVRVMMDSPGDRGGVNVQASSFMVLPHQSAEVKSHVRQADHCSLWYEWDYADVGLTVTNGVQGEF
jgi:hypothetical protein